MPTVPGIPAKYGLSAANTSFAFQAVTTGICNLSNNLSNSSSAPPKRIPVPTKINGAFAFLIFSKIVSTTSSLTSGTCHGFSSAGLK